MNRPILITGCQRSGTTLLHLILDSHPEIRGVDESEYWRDRRFARYLEDVAYGPHVAFKLPAIAHDLEALSALPGLQLLWCVRDPRDVVLSMLDLHLRISSLVSVSWAVHPDGARREIRNASLVLGESLREALLPYANRYRRFLTMPVSTPEEDEAVFASALCWRIKNELPPLYVAAGVTPKIVRYEELISDPESAIREIVAFLGLDWHDDLLRHHQLHSGVSIGNTVNSRAIDASNQGKWKGRLPSSARETIVELCGEVAASFGYELGGSGSV